MNKVILNEQKIIDNITEGYPVTVIREDGFRYIISMERKRGEEVYSYQFGRIKREFDSFDGLENALSLYEFTEVIFDTRRMRKEGIKNKILDVVPDMTSSQITHTIPVLQRKLNDEQTNLLICGQGVGRNGNCQLS